MRFASFSSGSSGNCEYIGNSTTKLLLDAGISTKRIINGLSDIGVGAEELSGILITHEHSDHIQGLPVLLGKYKIPVYATNDTLEAIERNDKNHKIDTGLFSPIKPDVPFTIGGMDITPFSISHDAADPVCYRIDSGECHIGMATDLGVYDSYVTSKLSGCNVLFIEANYDIAMLQAGKYPFPLKKRILGERGHLSNDMSARLILELLGRNVKHVFLAHLSKENNYPMLAYETVRYELSKEYGDISKFNIKTTDRSSLSCAVTI